MIDHAGTQRRIRFTRTVLLGLGLAAVTGCAAGSARQARQIGAAYDRLSFELHTCGVADTNTRDLFRTLSLTAPGTAFRANALLIGELHGHAEPDARLIDMLRAGHQPRLLDPKSARAQAELRQAAQCVLNELPLGDPSADTIMRAQRLVIAAAAANIRLRVDPTAYEVLYTAIRDPNSLHGVSERSAWSGLALMRADTGGSSRQRALEITRRTLRALTDLDYAYSDAERAITSSLMAAYHNQSLSQRDVQGLQGRFFEPAPYASPDRLTAGWETITMITEAIDRFHDRSLAVALMTTDDPRRQAYQRLAAELSEDALYLRRLEPTGALDNRPAIRIQ